ncbi:MAG: Crp/Fnr family transcriptional regulator, partial [Spirochaetaceae bacterium]|nr:Crp/Fnr family transcriptional regulator [Spirochaetaceae bacterium]
MEKYLYVLQKSPLFKQIKDSDIFTMIKCLAGRVVHYKKDKMIFLAGDALTSIGVILSGAVQLTNDDIYGNRAIIAELKKGSLFAEAFAYANLEKIPVSVIASEESDILMIDCRNIIQKCSSNCTFHNKLVKNMIEIIARKNVMQNEKLDILSRRSTREKLLAFLSIQSKNSG